MKTAPKNRPQAGCYNTCETPSEKEFEPAVVVPRQCGHNPFLANFAPIIFVEQVPDTREDSSSPFPESKFGCEVPNIKCGNEAFEGIAIVTKFIVNKRAKKREFEGILVAVDGAGLDLVIWSVRRRVALVRARGELGGRLAILCRKVQNAAGHRL